MELATTTSVSSADLARAHSPRVTLTGADTTALVTAAGTGVVTYDGLDLTRWRGDDVEDADGLAVFLRDLDTGRVWTVGWRPGQDETRYEAHFGPGAVEIVREDDGLETRLRLAVTDGGAFVGRLRLAALDGRARRIEVTSAAEVVLNDRGADAAHPGFSKLFVETEAPDAHTLVARRRPRSPEDAPAFLVHWVDAGAEDVSYETDRLRFAGRARDRRQPVALDAPGPLAGTTGAVLDPVVAFRTVVEVPAEGAATRAFGLAGGRSRERVLGLARDLGSVDAVTEAIRSMTESAPDPEVEQSDASAPVAPPVPDARPSGDLRLDDHSLRLFNGIGGFSADGTEYVMHLRPDADGRPALPPLPWTNVIANEDVGFVVSERGTATSWTANSRENRLTPWFNDPAEDPGESLYVEDAESGAFWSPTPGPAPANAPYEVRHGFGYSTWRTVVDGVEQVTTQSVAHDAPARLTVVQLTNTTDAPRRLAVVASARLDLGSSNTPRETTTRRAGGVLFARNPLRGEFADRVAVARAVADGDVSLTADRAAFLGRFGTDAAPLAVAEGGPLDGTVGDGLHHAALRAEVDLAPGETKEVAFVIGEDADAGAAAALAERFGEIAAVRDAIDATRRFWAETTGALRIDTPEPALDLMVNGWLLYQNLSCRLWGRTAYYQSGGAYGYRDQLQDTSALVYARPDLTRAQILRNAAHQFEEGDVLHWWHPPLAKGIRTRFADDLLWLPLLASSYVAKTGDAGVFDEDVRFLTAPLLEEGQDEVFLQPEDAGTSASVYEHAARAIDRSLAVGAHGLPLMGVGDWNDGMNRVGREGTGESVWMGFFLAATIDAFLPHVEARGDDARAERYRQHRAHLQEALNDAGWDGDWYRRAFYDNGEVMGSKESDECQIDALAQAWAVLSGVAPEDRAARALDAMERRLVDEDAGILRLLDPPFDKTPNDPGYIKGYVPGVRENGGQYTHAALWAVRALAQAGRCERAAPLLTMLSPVSHGDTPEEVDTYKTEPYVIAADVYGVAPHVGRGGWTWYTGSAGWMLRVAVESVLGFGLDGGEAITLDPCVPAEWDAFSVRYRLPDGSGTVYAIRAERGDAPGLTLDGAPLAASASGWRVPIARDGETHQVVLTLA